MLENQKERNRQDINMKPNMNLGLNTPVPTPHQFPRTEPVAPAVKAATYDLHRMAMGVAMQNLMKRLTPKNPTGK
jgi:hypothetical protein